jgi:hypothetical protein
LIHKNDQKITIFAIFHSLDFVVLFEEFEKSSQVKLLITNNAFCIVQRATAQSKTGIFRDCGVAEAPPGFQAGWSDCMHFFSLFLFILFAHLEILQSIHWSPGELKHDAGSKVIRLFNWFSHCDSEWPLGRYTMELFVDGPFEGKNDNFDPVPSSEERYGV